MTSPTSRPDPQTARPDGEPVGSGNDDRGNNDRGNTRVRQATTGSGHPGEADMHDTRADASNPRLPHERDQSSDNQADPASQDDVMSQKAYQDAKGPQQDTSLAPVTDATYNDQVLDDGSSREGPRR